MTDGTDRWLRFAVSFAEMDLGALRPGDWMNLRQEFLALFAVERSKGDVPAESAGGFLPFGLPTSEYTEKDFEDLQVETKRLLKAAVYGREKPTGPEDYRGLYDAQPLGLTFSLHPGQRSVRVLGDMRDVFIAVLMFAVSRAPKLRIGICPEDGKLFHRVRRQLYCSRRCVQNANKRDQRKREADALLKAELKEKSLKKRKGAKK